MEQNHYCYCYQLALLTRFLKFIRRTVYANAINDGIVPLNFFINVLDYKGLAEIINSEELAQSDETGKIPESVELANKFLAVQTFLSYLMPQNKQVKSMTISNSR